MYIPPRWVRLSREEEEACPLFSGYTASIETFDVREVALQAELAAYRELLSTAQYDPQTIAQHVEREREKRIGRELERWRQSRIAECAALPEASVETLAPTRLRAVRFWK